ncbi:hypothetical protein GE061_015399 [Apolygus lucorum]|uniref:Uncharacterized protein n=1 Tax=Apolygus lucorum TaxID=248454 RepID=A0A8S9XMY5_APOLU|nr:hypothetical protein GE061_015399 [Apolygus lucorum]
MKFAFAAFVFILIFAALFIPLQAQEKALSTGGSSVEQQPFHEESSSRQTRSGCGKKKKGKKGWKKWGR